MSVKLLKSYAGMVNIAHELSDEQLLDIGNRVKLGYEEDKKSMSEWLSKAEEIVELACLESVRKDIPRPNAANIKLPLIYKACNEYSSRTYPQVFKDKNLVKSVSIGEDTPQKMQQGDKCAKYMNYQLLIKDQDWEVEHDRLLFLTALIGWICKKSYYDPVHDKIKTKLCDYNKVFVNSDITSLKDAHRITEEVELCMNDVIGRKNKEVDGQSVFLEKPCEELQELHKTDQITKNICFLEQEVYLDLDEDGYSEPYIVTVQKENWKVFRISPRFHEDSIQKKGDDVICIYPIQYYTDYHFLPNPKGKYQSVGFGILLLYLTNASNSVMNALLDSAFFANMKSGYMDQRCTVLPSTSSFHRQGEFKLVKCQGAMTLKEGIYQHEYGEPSAVLFQLLGFLVKVAQDLTSSTEINSGTQNSQNAKTGATLALLKQGMATHEAIQKRHYRSLATEFKQLFDLNAIYLDKYQFVEYAGGQVAISRDDFDIKKIHIMPVADPDMASDAERLQQAQVMMSFQSNPAFDDTKLMALVVSKINIPGLAGCLVPANAPPKPNPEMLKIQGQLEEAGQKLNLAGHKMELDNHTSNRELIIKAHLAQGQLAVWLSQANLNYEQAKKLGNDTTLEDYGIQLKAIQTQLQTKLDLLQMDHEKDMQAADHAQDFMSQQQDQQHEQGMQQNDIDAQQQQTEQENQGGQDGSGAGDNQT